VNKFVVDRRNALNSATTFGAASIFTPQALAMGLPSDIVDSADLDLSDPKVRFQAKLKVRGSLAEENVHRVSTGHVWMYLPETHSYEPFCSLENYQVSEWTHSKDGMFRSRMFEAAIYMKFGTDEVMETWKNPFTGETVEVHHYAIGPMKATYNPNAIDSDAGAENAERVIIAKDINWQIVADTIYMPSDSSVFYRNPLQPDKWPRASAGEFFGWDSFIMFAAKVADLSDPGIKQAMAQSWYQENIRWQPWMLMGERPGRLVARGFGKKMRWDTIPVDRVKRIEKYVPEVLDRDSWSEFKNEFLWYMRTQQPRPPLGKD